MRFFSESFLDIAATFHGLDVLTAPDPVGTFPPLSLDQGYPEHPPVLFLQPLQLKAHPSSPAQEESTCCPVRTSPAAFVSFLIAATLQTVGFSLLSAAEEFKCSKSALHFAKDDDW